LGFLKISVDFKSGFAALFNGEDVFDRGHDHNGRFESVLSLDVLAGSVRMVVG
jgi:hypothetical protein